jgi:hypothetical protein
MDIIIKIIFFLFKTNPNIPIRNNNMDRVMIKYKNKRKQKEIKKQ